MITVGVLVLLFGMLLIVVGGLTHQSVQQSNQGCSHVPSCTPEADQSGRLYAAGGVVAAIGVSLTVMGAIRSGREPARTKAKPD